MTVSSRQRDRAAREATYWLVALEEETETPGIRAEFEAWLTASPVNAAAWTNTTDIYELLANITPAYRDHWLPFLPASEKCNVLKSVDLKDPHIATGDVDPRRRFASVRRRVAVFAAAALAACFALVTMPSIFLNIEADYVTSTAELRTFSLPDGSTVHLGAKSALSVEFGEHQRKIRLLRGEAFFEVSPNPVRPFRVTTRNVAATVLGTAFEMRRQEEGAAVAVRHGKVGVVYPPSRPSVSETLSAGDWVMVSWTGEVRRGTAPSPEVGAWMEGQIVARDRPLESVIDDLRRYYDGVIVIASNTLAEQRVSGVYNVADPLEALTAMAGAHGGKVHRISPWVLFVSEN